MRALKAPVLQWSRGVAAADASPNPRDWIVT
jgi:hypothetical protein